MKITSILIIVCFSSIYAQHTHWKVGNDPTTISSAAVFEVESTTKGFLPPRMTKTQMRAIANPIEGLMVYETDSKCLRTYSNGSWTGCYTFAPSVSASCNSVFWDAIPRENQIYKGSFSLPYIYGDGGNYESDSVLSTGVIGLVATRSSGSLNLGSGIVVYSVIGTPNTSGVARFVVNNLNGGNCEVSVVVSGPILGDFADWAPEIVGSSSKLVDASGNLVTTITQSMLGNYYAWGTTTPAATASSGAMLDSSPASTGLNMSWDVSTLCPSGYTLPTKDQVLYLDNKSATKTYIGTCNENNTVTNYSCGLKIGSGNTATDGIIFPASGFYWDKSLIMRGKYACYACYTKFSSSYESGCAYVSVIPSTSQYTFGYSTGEMKSTTGLNLRCIKK